MKTFSKISAAALIATAALSYAAPAFAHGGAGGGGWANNNALATKKAAKDAAVCAVDADKCVGFGKHYYGQ